MVKKDTSANVIQSICADDGHGTLPERFMWDRSGTKGYINMSLEIMKSKREMENTSKLWTKEMFDILTLAKR